MAPAPHHPNPCLPDPHAGTLDRRAFLRRAGRAGGAGLLLAGAPSLLAACGGGDDGEGAVERLGSLDEAGPALVGLFNYQGGYLVSGTPQRAVFAIATPAGPPATDGPPTLTGQLSREGGEPTEVVLDRYADGTPIPYYPLRTTFDEPGVWTFTADVEGVESRQSFQVQEPGQVRIVQVGQPMPAVDTPTLTDARGVTPICTQAGGPCALHTATEAEALAAGGPVVLLISTPAYCQTAVCGPVLDLVLEQVAANPGTSFVHAEVYNDPAAGSDPATAGTTAAVEAFGLTFEPSLFVARADGTVTARLDNVFDRVELGEALATATA